MQSSLQKVHNLRIYFHNILFVPLESLLVSDTKLQTWLGPLYTGFALAKNVNLIEIADYIGPTHIVGKENLVSFNQDLAFLSSLQFLVWTRTALSNISIKIPRLLWGCEGGIKQKHLHEQKVDFHRNSTETAPSLWQYQPPFLPCLPFEFLGNGALWTAQSSWKDDHQNLQSRWSLQERKSDYGTEPPTSASLQKKKKHIVSLGSAFCLDQMLEGVENAGEISKGLT